MAKSVINDVYIGLRAELILASHNPQKMLSSEVNVPVMNLSNSGISNVQLN